MLAFERLQFMSCDEAQVEFLGIFTEPELFALKVAVDAMNKHDIVVIDSDCYTASSHPVVYCLAYDGRDLAQVKAIVEIIDSYRTESAEGRID